MKNFASHLLTGLGALVLLFQQVTSQNVTMDDDNDDFAYSNPNDHYKPNQYVHFGHMMSRNSEFKADLDFVKNSAYMPAILAGLGILAFLLINLFFFFRCCCTCIKCLPDETEEKYKTKRFRVLMAFYFILFAALAFDQLMFLGNAKIGQSVDTLQSSVDYVGNIVNGVITDAAAMVDYGGTMITDVTTISDDVDSCVYAQTLDFDDYLETARNTSQAFHEQSVKIGNKTDSVDKIVNKAHDYIDKYGNEYRFKVICAIWLIAVLAVLLIFLTHMCRTKCGLQTVLLWVWIVFLIYLVLGAIWGMFVTTVGEFCMTPLYNLNKLAPEGGMRNLTLYYTACQGEGVIQNLINEAVTQVVELNSTLTNITATAMANNYNDNCPGNNLIADVQALQTTLTGVVVTIQDVSSLTNCESIQPLFFDFFNEALCTEMYSGVFYIWGSMLWTNFFLFLSVLVASYVWQYYAFWNGVPVTEVNHDFEEVNRVDDDSDEEQAGEGVEMTSVQPSAPAAERNSYFDPAHASVQYHQPVDPYAAPDAHQDVVIPAQVVYVNPHEDEGDVAMVDVTSSRDSSNRDSTRDSKGKPKAKKGPKKAKRSSGNEYDEVEGGEAQI